MNEPIPSNAGAHTDLLTIPILSEPDWLAARAGYIGASDLATIAGAPGAYGTPYALALRLRGEAPPNEQTRAMRRGTHLEAGILSWWAEEQGFVHRLHRPAGRLWTTRPEWPGIGATPDALLLGFDSEPEAVVEAKSAAHPGAREEWGDDGDPAGVPLRTQVQCQGQMAMTGLLEAYVVAYLGGDDLRAYRLEADPEFQGRVLAAAIDFRRRVLAGWTPDPTAADLGLLRDRWPLDTGATVDLAPELSEVAAAYEAAKEELSPLAAQVKIIEGRRDDAKARLIAAIGENAYGLLPDGVRYSLVAKPKEGYSVKPSISRTLRRQ